MNFFKALFNKKSKFESDQQHYEKDNVGTRITSANQADTVWQVSYLINGTGSVNYQFDYLDSAKRALSQLSYIHIANDTGELISSETIEYGYYEREGKGEVIIWGDSFTEEMWNEANEKLSNAKGLKRVSQKPKVKAKNKIEKINSTKAEDVKFVKTEYNKIGGITATYKYYSGPSKSSALEFLKQITVKEQFYQIVVETPEGIFARDIKGIYEG